MNEEEKKTEYESDDSEIYGKPLATPRASPNLLAPPCELLFPHIA